MPTKNDVHHGHTMEYKHFCYLYPQLPIFDLFWPLSGSFWPLSATLGDLSHFGNFQVLFGCPLLGNVWSFWLSLATKAIFGYLWLSLAASAAVGCFWPLRHQFCCFCLLLATFVDVLTLFGHFCGLLAVFFLMILYFRLVSAVCCFDVLFDHFADLNENSPRLVWTTVLPFLSSVPPCTRCTSPPPWQLSRERSCFQHMK